MRTLMLFLSSLVLALTASAPALHAQDALKSLQGRWVVTGGEHNGKPMDSLKGGVMTITGSNFEIRTASGNMLRGSLRADASKRPAEVDLVHADGEKWEAIYAVEANTLKLNYVEAGGKDPRPKAFATSATTEESIVTLQRDK